MRDRARSSSPLAPKLRAAFAVLGCLFVTRAVVGCVEEEPFEVECPPFEDFLFVSAVLENRCGMLDCHGDTARPLKIYGRIGLRGRPPGDLDDPNFDPDEHFAGGQPTQPFEVLENWRSVCGLEPEKTHEVVTAEGEVADLTVVRKPRLQEAHKGGRIWDEGKAGDRCLVRWIEADYVPGTFNPVDCLEELQ